MFRMVFAVFDFFLYLFDIHHTKYIGSVHTPAGREVFGQRGKSFQQFLIVHLHEARSIEALPKLADTAESRRLVLESLHRIRELRQPELTQEQERRLSRVQKLLTRPPSRTARRESVAAMK